MNESDIQTGSLSNGETTRRHLKEFWRILSKHTGIDRLTEVEPVKRAARPKPAPKHSVLLFLLSLMPWVSLTGFIISFFWDFPGRSVTILGTVYSLEGILRIVSISGLIGFLTNWLAINMLFRPTRKHPLLGQGLIPAHKNRIAYRLALAVSEDLINPEMIKHKIKETRAVSRYREKSVRYLKNILDEPEFREDIKNWTVDYVEAMIADPELRAGLAKKIIREMENALEERSLEKVALKAYSYLRGDEMQQIVEDSLARLPASVEKGLVQLDDLMDQLPEKLEHNSETIENLVTAMLYRLINQLDVHTLVEENLQEYDEGKLENLIRGATNEQLRYIQYLGGLLGTIGGLVIWQPLLSLAALMIIFIAILSLDRLFMIYLNR